MGDERLRPLECAPDKHTRLSFSPNGRLLAATGERFTHAWRWPGGELLQKRPHQEGAAKYLSFSSDSRHVLSPGPKGEVCLWDAYTGQTIKTISTNDGYVVNAAVSPDARLAAFADFNHKVRMYSLANDDELWCQSTSGRSIAFSLDNRFLATVGYASGADRHWRINVHDASSGQHLFELTGHNTPIAGIAFASDGLLYSWDIRGVIRGWNVESQCEQWSFSTFAWASKDPTFREDSEKQSKTQD